MNIQEVIRKELLTVTGKINSAIIRRESFGTTELAKAINDICKFGDTYSEKIYCILNDISSHPKCPICTKQVRFRTFQDGYSRTCNAAKCMRKSNPNWGSSSIGKKKTHLAAKDQFLSYYNSKAYPQVDMSVILDFIKHQETKTNGGSSHNWVDDKVLREQANILCNVLDLTVQTIPFNPSEKRMNWSQRFYHLVNCLTSMPLCSICKVKTTTYRNFKHGYSTTCGVKECTQRYGCRNRMDGVYETLSEEASKQNFQLITNKDQFNGVNHTRVELRCLRCDTVIDRMLKNGGMSDIYCYGCYGKSGSSKGESEIAEFIEGLGIEVVRNSRQIIPPLELDVYIPSKKIGIEYNGLYWHSEASKDRSYHIDKTNKCAASGIGLIQIFENEWMQKRDIVKSMLKAKLGVSNVTIYARNCTVHQIAPQEKAHFLAANHIQGKDNSMVAYGLVNNGELVCVMTFGKRQITMGTPNWELIRFCSKINTRVVGGASRLLAAFEAEYKPTLIKTYADLRYSTSPSFYQKLGFTLKHISRPNYWYVRGDRLLHRVNFQKHKLKNVIDNFNPDITEQENMKLAGYHRVWDCGNYVFEKYSPAD